MIYSWPISLCYVCKSLVIPLTAIFIRLSFDRWVQYFQSIEFLCTCILAKSFIYVKTKKTTSWWCFGRKNNEWNAIDTSFIYKLSYDFHHSYISFFLLLLFLLSIWYWYGWDTPVILVVDDTYISSYIPLIIWIKEKEKVKNVNRVMVKIIYLILSSDDEGQLWSETLTKLFNIYNSIHHTTINLINLFIIC